MLSSWMNVVIVVFAFAFGGVAASAQPVGARKAGQTFRDCPECPEMVVVPPGRFLMGSSAADAEQVVTVVNLPFVTGFVKGFVREEQPQHPVRIGHSFAIGKYLITRGEFATFVHETGYSPATDCIFYRNNRYSPHPGGNWQVPGFPQTDSSPVVCVSWYDAAAYVQWLNRTVGGGTTRSSAGPYHLPSEAEWEYAARAGTRTARWWGDALGVNNANCDGCGNSWGTPGTAPVTAFHPNPFGLFGMLGNASQWTADCWNPNYDGAPRDGSAWTTGDCELRVTRGGGWESYPWVIRSAARTREDVDRGADFIGFRVTRALPDVGDAH